MTMKREPSISEQQAREIVERMGRRESRSEKSMDDFYQNIGLDPEQLAQPGRRIPICKGLVLKMGGNISVMSEEGFGSTFIFTLPMKRPNSWKN